MLRRLISIHGLHDLFVTSALESQAAPFPGAAGLRAECAEASL